MVAISIHKTYNTAGGGIVKITEVIDRNDPDNRLDIEAGYVYRSSTGRNYTACGDHNDSDLVIVSECVEPVEAYVAGSEGFGKVISRERNCHGSDGMLYEVDYYRGHGSPQKRYHFRDSFYPISEEKYRNGIRSLYHRHR